MTIVETRPPLCRHCAAPIAKKAVKVHFITGNKQLENSKFERFVYVDEHPGTIETVRGMLPDLIVLTVRDHRAGLGIATAYGWDGHSFADLYFCSGQHAREFGYTAAIGGMASLPYQAAMRRRYPDAPTKQEAPADPPLPSWDRWNR